MRKDNADSRHLRSRRVRRLAAPLLALLVLAGCASPDNKAQEDETGPIDLSDALGLILLDLDMRERTVYTERTALAWMSADARAVSWTEENFAIVVDRSTGGRDVGPLTIWTRIYGNGTGLELVDGKAHLRDIVTGTIRSTTPVAPAPIQGFAWTAASDDLAVLGGEYAVSGRPSCANDIILRGEKGERTIGCHLEISADGRAGWSEATGVRLRERNGTVISLTGFGQGDPSNGSYVGHENPVFTADGLFMLRLTGGSEVGLTEVVTRDGTVVAKMDGPRRLALHDASSDGRYLLVRAFDR